MKEHLIKPSAFGADRQYSVTDGMLNCRGGGENWSLALEEVQEVYFVQHRGSGQVFWRLDLLGTQVSHHVDATFPFANRQTNPDAAGFIALSDEICDTLTSVNPGFRLGYAEHGRARTALFVIGGLAFLSALALLILALYSGVTVGKLATGGIVLSMLAVLGGLMMRTYNPWREPAPISANRLPRILRHMVGRAKGSA